MRVIKSIKKSALTHKGMTLIEVVAAMVIISLAGLLLLNGFLGNARLQNHAIDRARAAEEAKNQVFKMEKSTPGILTFTLNGRQVSLDVLYYEGMSKTDDGEEIVISEFKLKE